MAFRNGGTARCSEGDEMVHFVCLTYLPYSDAESPIKSISLELEATEMRSRPSKKMHRRPIKSSDSSSNNILREFHHHSLVERYRIPD